MTIKGSRLRGRPKNRWRNCAKQISIDAKKLEREVKKRVDWKKSFKEANVRIGLYFQLRGRRKKKKKQEEEEEEEKEEEKEKKKKKRFFIP
jgi:outer membrane cobalamin receptor